MNETDMLKARIRELEEQLKLAFEYQREVDAKIADKYLMSVDYEYDTSFTIAGGYEKHNTWITTTYAADIAKKIREQE